MPERRAKYSATNKNLEQYALPPAMKFLVKTALDGSTITYGKLKKQIEDEASISTIFATRIGFVVETLMKRIHEVDSLAPLINILVVNQVDRLPGIGVGHFMATRFKYKPLGEANFKQRNPEEWKQYFEKAAGEVYSYSEDKWIDLCHRVFPHDFSLKNVAIEHGNKNGGNENDYGAGVSKYGPGGEGEHHRSLRLWIKDNPHKVLRSSIEIRSETEFDLDSGDRVDVVYHLSDRTIVLEVKSRISNLDDLKRGVFQCIKYRAVKKAMDVRSKVNIEAYLVTEVELPGEISSLLKLHGIRHYKAPMIRD